MNKRQRTRSSTTAATNFCASDGSHVFTSFANDPTLNARKREEFRDIVNRLLPRQVLMPKRVDWDLLRSMSVENNIKAILEKHAYDEDGNEYYICHAWERVFDIAETLYRELIVEFVATFHFDAIKALGEFHQSCMTFRLGGVWRSLSLVDFALALGIYTQSDVDAPGMVNKRKPNIKFFRVFGCICYLLNNRDDLGKFDAKLDESIFIGYSLNSATYRVYNKRTRSIFESRYVDFSETEMYSGANTCTASPIFPELNTVSPPSTTIPTNSFGSDFVDLAEFDLTTLVGPIIVLAPSDHTIRSSTSISADAFVNESSSCSTAVGETSSSTIEPVSVLNPIVETKSSSNTVNEETILSPSQLSSTQPSPETAVEVVREQTVSLFLHQFLKLFRHLLHQEPMLKWYGNPVRRQY
ncbi:hypothetical protein OSB04_001638 [Centaurea solstitialis]|uniref:Retroviral polymerase SH3-like domain-containing protein n=1 Tax=Centaurea solstitialis TaxID=347529 RepID=A0AA38WLY0_9ASTR|nr:hypothetical protein OSB04_001638 [Centaurea solstitialis]